MFEPDSLSLRLLYKPLFRLVDGVLDRKSPSNAYSFWCQLSDLASNHCAMNCRLDRKLAYQIFFLPFGNFK